MEWSTVWAAVSAGAGVASAIGIRLAVSQLRFDAWLKAQEVFTSDDFVKARASIFAHFDNAQNPFPPTKGEEALRVCRKMNELAHLSGAVGRDRMLSAWGNPVAKAWLLLEPTVKEERTVSAWDKKWSQFQTLGEEAMKLNPKLAERRKQMSFNGPSHAPQAGGARA